MKCDELDEAARKARKALHKLKHSNKIVNQVAREKSGTTGCMMSMALDESDCFKIEETSQHCLVLPGPGVCQGKFFTTLAVIDQLPARLIV